MCLMTFEITVKNFVKGWAYSKLFLNYGSYLKWYSIKFLMDDFGVSFFVVWLTIQSESFQLQILTTNSFMLDINQNLRCIFFSEMNTVGSICVVVW